jgi:transposase InsO family protein
VHADRGSNYTSAQFAKTLKKLKLRQPVGRTGAHHDLHHEEDVQSLEEHRIDMDEVVRQQSRRLRSKKLPPDR